MFNCHFLSILNGLDVIRIFLFGWDFPTGGEMLWILGETWLSKRQMREKHLLGGHFFTPNCVFWAILREIISISLACAGEQETKRLEGRKKSQDVYISRMRVSTPSGRIPTKRGKYVRLTDIIKHTKFHHYNLRGFWAVRCWSFHVAIGTQGVLSTLLGATTPQVIAWALSYWCWYIISDSVQLNMNIQHCNMLWLALLYYRTAA